MTRPTPRAEDVIAHLERTATRGCAGCGAELGGHAAVLGLMLGFADEPLCLDCLAARHGRERVEFLEAAHRNVRRLACYRAGWRHADRRLEAAGPWPEERLPSRLRMPAEGDDDEQELESAPDPASAFERAASASPSLERWDAGDRGCGELALELKLRVRRLAPGQRLLLETTDLGAPADLPAWCRLTGNLLVAADPPRFLIEAATRSDLDPSP